jgi:putative ABC transport system substrate-binding protein
MAKKIVIGLLTTVMLAAGSLAKAQQPTKIPRIGYVIGPSLAENSVRIEALRQGLRELGYVEGKNIVIEWRSADGRMDRLPGLIGELIRLQVDILVSAGPTVTRLAKDATNKIPIVMAQDSDPVGNGFAASLARPGGNVTGLSALAPEISGKQMELLKEIVPTLARVAVFGEPANPGYVQQTNETELAAKALKVQLQILNIRDPKDFAAAFQAARKARADAALVAGGPVLNSQRRRVVELAVKNRLPVIYNELGFVEAGGLMTYGASFVDLYRRAATYVDKILKGRAPADLPVEQPKKFDFIVNLKAAKQIGLTIPPNVLVRADRVIK